LWRDKFIKMYTSDSHITTIREVKDFFHFLAFDLQLEFHPDDRFESYIDQKTRESRFLASECELYDRLMEEAFTVCDDADEDIYDLGWEQLEKALSI